MRRVLSTMFAAAALGLLGFARVEAQTIVTNPGVSLVVPIDGDAGRAARDKLRKDAKARRDARAKRRVEARTRRRVRTLTGVRRLSSQAHAQRRSAGKTRSRRMKAARLKAASRYRLLAGRLLARLRKRYAKDKGFQREAETLRRLLRL